MFISFSPPSPVFGFNHANRAAYLQACECFRCVITGPAIGSVERGTAATDDGPHQWHGWQQAGPMWLSPSVRHSMVRSLVVTASAAPCMEEATNGCPPAVPVCQGSPSRGATRSCKRAQPLEAHRGRCQCRRSRSFPQHGARYGPVLRGLPSSQPHLTCAPFPQRAAWHHPKVEVLGPKVLDYRLPQVSV